MRAHAHAPDPSSKRRSDIAFSIGVLFALAVLAWVVITVQQMSHDLRVSNQARDALAQQVQGLGHTPVAGPPGSRGIPGRGGDVGPAGEPGPSGPPGPSGSPGAKGETGASGAAGEAGQDGQPGPSGAPGVNGADGQVGPQGDPGPAGPQGDPGPQGEQGEKGDPGPAGPNCPDGYSLQTPPTDPDALECRRDSSGSGGQTPNTPQAMGLDPLRRQYP